MAKVQTRFKEGQPRHFIKEWRKHRRLTQERLAERLGVTHGAISQLERGMTGYTQPMLEALAEALTCEPADLIMREPGVDAAPWSILDGLKPAQRNEALRYIEFLKSTGTDG